MQISRNSTIQETLQEVCCLFYMVYLTLLKCTFYVIAHSRIKLQVNVLACKVFSESLTMPVIMYPDIHHVYLDT